MRLLFDQNLSPALVRLLGDLHPGSLHVRDADLRRTLDDELCTYAIEHDYAIVSKDQEFAERALVEGPPPKVLWIRLGNCSTADVGELLREYDRAVRAFASDERCSLSLSGGAPEAAAGGRGRLLRFWRAARPFSPLLGSPPVGGGRDGRRSRGIAPCFVGTRGPEAGGSRPE